MFFQNLILLLISQTHSTNGRAIRDSLINDQRGMLPALIIIRFMHLILFKKLRNQSRFLWCFIGYRYLRPPHWFLLLFPIKYAYFYNLLSRDKVLFKMKRGMLLPIWVSSCGFWVLGFAMVVAVWVGRLTVKSFS